VITSPVKTSPVKTPKKSKSRKKRFNYDPALPSFPTGIWKCCECSAVEKTRKTRCGECSACKATDCGKCIACLDKPKFGGLYQLKRSCARRECPYLSFADKYVDGKIPGELTRTTPTKKRQNESVSAPGEQTKRAKIEKVAVTHTPSKTKRRDSKSSHGTSKVASAKEVKPPRKGASKKNNSTKSESTVINIKIPKLMDAVSIKVRKIIKGAQKDNKDSKIQDKACEHLRQDTLGWRR